MIRQRVLIAAFPAVLAASLVVYSVYSDYMSDYTSEHRKAAAPVIFRPDIGPDLHPTDRPCVWDFQRSEVGGYAVAVGPWYYQDQWSGYNEPRPTRPVFYRIEISTLICGTGLLMAGRSLPTPYFQRDFLIDELPAGFHKKPIREVMCYDVATRTVAFHLGMQEVRYQLP